MRKKCFIKNLCRKVCREVHAKVLQKENIINKIVSVSRLQFSDSVLSRNVICAVQPCNMSSTTTSPLSSQTESGHNFGSNALHRFKIIFPSYVTVQRNCSCLLFRFRVRCAPLSKFCARTLMQLNVNLPERLSGMKKSYTQLYSFKYV